MFKPPSHQERQREIYKAVQERRCATIESYIQNGKDPNGTFPSDFPKELRGTQSSAPTILNIKSARALEVCKELQRRNSALGKLIPGQKQEQRRDQSLALLVGLHAIDLALAHNGITYGLNIPGLAATDAIISNNAASLLSRRSAKFAYNPQDPNDFTALHTGLIELLYVDQQLTYPSDRARHPLNSSLYAIFTRKQGNSPILTAAHKLIADKIGLTSEGMYTPNQYVLMVREPTRREALYDCDDRGREISVDEIRATYKESKGILPPWTDSFIRQADPISWITSVITQLRFVFERDRNYLAATQMIEALIILYPDDATALKKEAFERASRAENIPVAAAFLADYLTDSLAKNDRDFDRLTDLLVRMRAASHRNR